MIDLRQAHSVRGRDMYDTDGDKIGSVGQVWEDGNGQPTWASVRTGLFGLNESLVPLQQADLQGDDRLVVPFQKSKVKDAPNVDASHDEPLTRGDVEKLYEYYGLDWAESFRSHQAGSAGGGAGYRDRSEYSESTGSSSSSSAAADHRDRAGYDSSAARTATGTTGDDAMTRSEERLNVGKETEQVGQARLRKYVVKEQQEVRVPVAREEVRLEREPITDANRGAALGGPDITEAEHEVTLRAERPVVDTETVPVERVRLGKETVTEDQTVGGEVRKERIDADLPDDKDRRGVS